MISFKVKQDTRNLLEVTLLTLEGNKIRGDTERVQAHIYYSYSRTGLFNYELVLPYYSTTIARYEYYSLVLRMHTLV